MNIQNALATALVRDQKALGKALVRDQKALGKALVRDQEALLGKAFARDQAQAPRALSKKLVTATAPTSILQINPLPTTLDPSLYANARSNTNPGGDLRPLYALRQLVDPVPVFGTDYQSSGNSTERLYKQVLDGANALPDAGFAASTITSSKKNFEYNVFANLDGTVGNWRPVYATPSDWYDTSKSGRFRPLEIDLTQAGGAPESLQTLGNTSDLKLKVGTEVDGKTIDSSTRLRSLQMNYLLVELARPWFNVTLFSLDGWFLGQQRVGFCSSGSMEQNAGVLPLVPTGMLLGMQAAVDADWSAGDSTTLGAARDAGHPVFLGPFLIDGPKPAASVLQVIGWVSVLTPLSPRVGSQKVGSVTVRN